MHEALLYEPLKANAVVCTACKLKCRIREGRSGVCGVRTNVEGKLYLLIYGKAAAAHVDPIEKKPLYHFLPGTVAFSVGTIGCNFGCSFCQNWDISQLSRTLRTRLKKERREHDLKLVLSKNGYDLPPKEIVDLCVQHQIPTIAYTYNEPVIFFEYLYDTIRLASPHGIRNIFVSNGYESEEALDLLGDRLDAINIDLKSFSDRFYTKVCKARLQPVLDSIQDVHTRRIWTEITTLIIPGQNDSDSELRDIAGFIASVDKGIPWHISRFHPDYQMTDNHPTPRSTIIRAFEIGKEAGLKYVYVGNMRDGQRENTYCPDCRTLLIRRNGYSVDVQPAFEKGTCTHCQTQIDGVWN